MYCSQVAAHHIYYLYHNYNGVLYIIHYLPCNYYRALHIMFILFMLSLCLQNINSVYAVMLTVCLQNINSIYTTVLRVFMHNIYSYFYVHTMHFD